MRARLGFAAAVALGSLAACGAGDPDAATTSTARVTVAAARPVAAGELVVGDCLGQVPVGAQERTMIESAPVVSCEQPHQLEVFAVFQFLPDRFETDPPGAYPGQERVVGAADEGCVDQLEALAEPDGLGLISLWPTADSWLQGDRTVACAVFQVDGTPFEVRRLLAGA